MPQKRIDDKAFRDFPGIESSKDWKSVRPIRKGWSGDQKFLVKTNSGESLLLRLSDRQDYEAKKKEFEVITKYSGLGIRMSMPLEFGICNDGRNVYMLLSWMEGRDLESALPKLSEKKQYLLGRQAGTILRKIHSIPVAPEDFPQKTKKEKKLLQLARYEESDVRIPGDEIAIRYVKDHIDQIWKKSPVYQHGDFHPGNLIYGKDGNIGVIDFNRWEVSDPYEEFHKLESFGTEVSIPYCVGQIDAYFQDRIPKDFWEANAVYVAHASLFSIVWAKSFTQKDVDGMVARARRAFDDFDGFRQTVPKWYTKSFSEKYGPKRQGKKCVKKHQDSRHYNMQRIKSKDTSIELKLRKALWAKGYRYRKNVRDLPGVPDIVLTKYKIAIFCDSEFFHGKDWEVLKPQLERGNNAQFWIDKILKTKERDDAANKKLLYLGWTVIRFWGRDILKDVDTCVKVVEETIFDEGLADLGKE